MPATKTDSVEVVIVAPVHNRREITLRCLRSIARLERDGIGVHTIIVDDGSSDGTQEAIARDFPEVEVIRGNGDLWYTEGTNVGMRAALRRDPDFVLAINDDQVFHAAALQRLVATARRVPRAVVGALLLRWDTPHRVFQVAPVWRTAEGGWKHWYQQTVWSVPERPWRVDFIVGNCVLYPAGALREAGLLNARRYPHFGDAEFTPRLRRHGFELLIEPRARVFCQPNEELPRARDLPLRQQLDVLLLDLKHPQNLRRRFRCYWDTAPSRLQAVVGFAVFLAQAVLGVGGPRPGEREPPLSQLFADEVVD